MHLSLCYVVLVCNQYDVCEDSVGSVYIGGYGGLSESRLCVFRELCPVSFLLVGECCHTLCCCIGKLSEGSVMVLHLSGSPFLTSDGFLSEVLWFYTCQEVLSWLQTAYI